MEKLSESYYYEREFVAYRADILGSIRKHCIQEHLNNDSDVRAILLDYFGGEAAAKTLKKLGRFRRVMSKAAATLDRELRAIHGMEAHAEALETDLRSELEPLFQTGTGSPWRVDRPHIIPPHSVLAEVSEKLRQIAVERDRAVDMSKESNQAEEDEADIGVAEGASSYHSVQADSDPRSDGVDLSIYDATPEPQPHNPLHISRGDVASDGILEASGLEGPPLERDGATATRDAEQNMDSGAVVPQSNTLAGDDMPSLSSPASELSDPLDFPDGMTSGDEENDHDERTTDPELLSEAWPSNQGVRQKVISGIEKKWKVSFGHVLSFPIFDPNGKVGIGLLHRLARLSKVFAFEEAMARLALELEKHKPKLRRRSLQYVSQSTVNRVLSARSGGWQELVQPLPSGMPDPPPPGPLRASEEASMEGRGGSAMAAQMQDGREPEGALPTTDQSILLEFCRAKKAHPNAFTEREVALLLKLKEKDNLAWKDIAKSFMEPRRTVNCLHSKYYKYKAFEKQKRQATHHRRRDEAPLEGHDKHGHQAVASDVVVDEQVTDGHQLGIDKVGTIDAAPARQPGKQSLDGNDQELPQQTAAMRNTGPANDGAAEARRKFKKQSQLYRDVGCMLAENEDVAIRRGLGCFLSEWVIALMRKEDTQSAEKVDSLGDVLTFHMRYHNRWFLDERWAATQDIDEALTNFVFERGGMGQVDTNRKVVPRTFGSLRRSAIALHSQSARAVPEMLSANPRPEKRGPVEGAIQAATQYLLEVHLPSVQSLEMRAWHLFEAILADEHVKKNVKVKQSALSSLRIAVDRCRQAKGWQVETTEDAAGPSTSTEDGNVASSQLSPAQHDGDSRTSEPSSAVHHSTEEQPLTRISTASQHVSAEVESLPAAINSAPPAFQDPNASKTATTPDTEVEKSTEPVDVVTSKRGDGVSAIESQHDNPPSEASVDAGSLHLKGFPIFTPERTAASPVIRSDGRQAAVEQIPSSPLVPTIPAQNKVLRFHNDASLDTMVNAPLVASIDASRKNTAATEHLSQASLESTEVVSLVNKKPASNDSAVRDQKMVAQNGIQSDIPVGPSADAQPFVGQTGISETPTTARSASVGGITETPSVRVSHASRKCIITPRKRPLGSKRGVAAEEHPLRDVAPNSYSQALAAAVDEAAVTRPLTSAEHEKLSFYEDRYLGAAFKKGERRRPAETDAEYNARRRRDLVRYATLRKGAGPDQTAAPVNTASSESSASLSPNSNEEKSSSSALAQHLLPPRPAIAWNGSAFSVVDTVPANAPANADDAPSSTRPQSPPSQRVQASTPVISIADDASPPVRSRSPPLQAQASQTQAYQAPSAVDFLEDDLPAQPRPSSPSIPDTQPPILATVTAIEDNAPPPAPSRATPSQAQASQAPNPAAIIVIDDDDDDEPAPPAANVGPHQHNGPPRRRGRPSRNPRPERPQPFSLPTLAPQVKHQPPQHHHATSQFAPAQIGYRPPPSISSNNPAFMGPGISYPPQHHHPAPIIQHSSPGASHPPRRHHPAPIIQHSSPSTFFQPPHHHPSPAVHVPSFAERYIEDYEPLPPNLNIEPPSPPHYTTAAPHGLYTANQPGYRPGYQTYTPVPHQYAQFVPSEAGGRDGGLPLGIPRQRSPRREMAETYGVMPPVMVFGEREVERRRAREVLERQRQEVGGERAGDFKDWRLLVGDAEEEGFVRRAGEREREVGRKRAREREVGRAAKRVRLFGGMGVGA